MSGIITSIKESGITQPDNTEYLRITEEGAEAYAKQWYGEKLLDDDLACVAKHVADRTRYASAGPVELAGEFGTGTSLLNAIITAPLCKRMVCLERSPANIAVCKKWLSQKQPDSHWEGWRQIIGIFRAQYDAGKAPLQWLREIRDTERDLYNSFKNWNQPEFKKEDSGTELVLNPDFVSLVKKNEIINRFVPERSVNPYFQGNVQQLLGDKVEFWLADGIDKVKGGIDPDAPGLPPLRDITVLEGKLDIGMCNHYVESVNPTLKGMAHAMKNWANSVKEGGLLDMESMAGSLEYGGVDEGFRLKLLEGYVTVPVLGAMHGVLVKATSKEQSAIVDHNQEGVTVGREGFAGVGAFCGIRNGRIFRTAEEFIEALHETHPDIQLINVGNRQGYITHIDNPALAISNMVKVVAANNKNRAILVVPNGSLADEKERDERPVEERPGRSSGDNASIRWSELGMGFWKSYANVSYVNPPTPDLEGLFLVIKNVKDRKKEQKGEEVSFLEVGAGSVPEFTLAAVMAGASQVTISDYSQEAVDWLNQELLGEGGPSASMQMWVNFAKLLSTFKNREELVYYCAQTEFVEDLKNWQKLPEEKKKFWFDERASALHSNGVGKDSFLRADYDLKEKLKAMHDEGRMQIRKFSIFEPPADLAKRPVDVVCAVCVAECITGKPIENCEALLSIYKLAKPVAGRVVLGQFPYANYLKQHGAAQALPTLPRSYSYLAIVSSILFKSNVDHLALYTSNASDMLVKERKATFLQATRAMEILEATDYSIQHDPRFSYTVFTSGYRKAIMCKDAEELLAQVHICILEMAKGFLLDNPARRNISPEKHLERLVAIEDALGIISPSEILLGDASKRNSSAAANQERNLTREDIGARIEDIIDYLCNPKNSRDAETMNRQDVLFSDFLYGLHKDIVGRKEGQVWC